MTARRAVVAPAIAGVAALVAAGLSAGGGATRSFMLDVRLDKSERHASTRGGERLRHAAHDQAEPVAVSTR